MKTRKAFPIFICMSCLLWLLSACLLLNDEAPSVAVFFPEPSPTLLAVRSPEAGWPAGLSEANSVMASVCFDAAYDTQEQVFVLRSAEELAAFYGLAEQSEICRLPIDREPFDFGGGRVLAGFWQYGRGCTAHHEVVGFSRDEARREIRIDLRLVIGGACAYELIRPFWVGIEGAEGFEIQIHVVEKVSVAVD